MPLLALPLVRVLQAQGQLPVLQLSNAAATDAASVGDQIGVLSIARGFGGYGFSLTSNPGGLFTISGASLKVAATLSVGSYPIAIRANNGVGSIVDASFLVSVTSAAGFSPSLDFSDARNSQYVPLIGV